MKIQVCNGKTCKDRFSEYVKVRLERDKKKFNLDNVEIENCPCSGNCKAGPIVSFGGNIEKYLDPAKAAKIMFDKIKK